MRACGSCAARHVGRVGGRQAGVVVAASFVAILAAGFLNAERAADVFAMLGATAAVIVILNLLHSYLLLVRYSAIAIMRRNVIEV